MIDDDLEGTRQTVDRLLDKIEGSPAGSLEQLGWVAILKEYLWMK